MNRDKKARKRGDDDSDVSEDEAFPEQEYDSADELSMDAAVIDPEKKSQEDFKKSQARRNDPKLRREKEESDSVINRLEMTMTNCVALRASLADMSLDTMMERLDDRHGILSKAHDVISSQGMGHPFNIRSWLDVFGITVIPDEYSRDIEYNMLNRRGSAIFGVSYLPSILSAFKEAADIAQKQYREPDSEPDSDDDGSYAGSEAGSEADGSYVGSDSGDQQLSAAQEDAIEEDFDRRLMSALIMGFSGCRVEDLAGGRKRRKTTKKIKRVRKTKKSTTRARRRRKKSRKARKSSRRTRK